MSADLLSEEAEREARELVARRMTATQSIQKAVPLVAGSLGAGLVVSLAYAIVSTIGLELVGRFFDWTLTQPPEALNSAAQLGMGFGMLLSLYAILQFMKRATASRSSWFPALFALPVVVAAGGVMLAGSPTGRQLGPALFQMLLMPWTLVLYSIGGAACAIAWVRGAHEVDEGRGADTSAILGEVGGRLVEISGPHGARQHAVTIGLQLLVPGIFYALQLAFVDAIAVLEPERGAWKRSGDLTYGMRSRLFRLYSMWFVLTIGIVGALQVGIGGTEAITVALVDPRALGLPVYFVSELVTALTSWVLTVALMVLYKEREAQVKAARALKRHKQALAAGA